MSMFITLWPINILKQYSSGISKLLLLSKDYVTCTVVLVLRTKSEQNSGWGAQSLAQCQVSLEDTAEKDI